MIHDLIELVPRQLWERSGKVFYSGRSAFVQGAAVYILGFNPGGSPLEQTADTIRQNIEFIDSENGERWSAYVDESWKDWAIGHAPLQRRMRHLFDRLDLDARAVPSSNIIFVRSTRTTTLDGPASEYASRCWPFHEHVIRHLKMRAVLCLGAKTGQIVRRRLRADELNDTFVECNRRRWRSTAYRSDTGVYVLTLSHSGIADWTAPECDPSAMVERVLSR